MANIILLHGAWHGPWCFEKLTSALKEQRHTITTPVLPCNKKSSNDQEISLSMYINIVKTELSKFDEPITLVGHSLSGLILCELATMYPDKIRKLIFIAGFIPNNGENLLSCSTEDIDADMSAAFMPPTDKTILTLDKNNIAEFLFNTCDDNDKIWAVDKLEPQKLTPFNDPVNYDNDILKQVNSIYIACEHDKAVSIKMQNKMADRIGCRKILLNSGHSPFIDMPNKVADIILSG